MNHGYGPVLKHNYPTHEINGLTTATVRKLCRDNLRPPDLLNKASILLQYLKIFVPQGRYRSPMLYAIHITLWLTISFYFAIMVVEIFACTPREKIWNPLVVGRCVNPTAILIAAASSNVATDFAILVLPMYTLLHLQMPRKRKLGILAVFATGALAYMTSAVRLNASINMLRTGDMTFSIAVVGLWTFAEIAIGITVACLPCTPRFFKEMRTRWPPRTNDSSEPGGSSQQDWRHWEIFSAQREKIGNEIEMTVINGSEEG
ncbi:MAG: hypothetical protein MMC33_007424 [Icmadophila ericetorum]|nr:hypothetical protein [Icmadophila ericetorum]